MAPRSISGSGARDEKSIRRSGTRSKRGSDLSPRSETHTPILELRHLTKRFGEFVAVDDVSLGITGGEFLTLLGASGSGKTTTLRMIAGFEQPTIGEILMVGSPITALPPFKRDINTVFQHYALFPHMSVRENIGYGLRMRGVPSAERAQRVSEALRMVRLDQLGARAPRQLSGGQQQRVALARALVNRPRLLLLDEPLGALDLKLRKEMQLELKHLQNQLGITFIYVTHDQEEALTMSDRIVLLRQGRIEQVGTARDLYDRPASRYVADFIGETNLIAGIVVDGGPGPVTLRVGNELLRGQSDVALAVGSPAWLSVRPEAVHFDVGGKDTPGENSVEGMIADAVYSGALVRVHVRLPGERRIIAQVPAGTPVQVGERAWVAWASERARCVTD
jgi:spermidine/putrescine transport system ATP-binding protein